MKQLLSMLAITLLWPFAPAQAESCPAWMDHQLQKLRSRDVIDMCATVSNKPLLIVNTASHCGFTPQFEGLEAIHQRYKDQGLVVLGVPSNDFWQEAKDDEETANICYINYGVTFLMTEKQHVKGKKAHPLFKHMSEEHGSPSWNFNKYLVDSNGKVVARFGSAVKPQSEELVSSIESVL